LKKELTLLVLVMLLFIVSSAKADHDLIESLRQGLTLTEKYVCSSGESVIEYREMRTPSIRMIVVENYNPAKKNPIILYLLENGHHDERPVYGTRIVDSPDIKWLSEEQWHKVLKQRDLNAWKKLLGKEGADCTKQ